MFRMWVKEWKDNHMIRDITICDAADPSEKNRTKKVFDTLEEACYELDVAKPIWLNVNVEEFKRIDKTRFSKDSFIEEVPFDYLEIHVIEEDDNF